MNRKKKQRKYLEEYWKKKGFDSEKELLIYQYLCNELGDWKAKKIEKEYQFREYKLWREHIECIVQNYKEDELIEFYHFIRLKERQCDTNVGIHTLLQIPFVVALVAGVFMSNLDKVFQLILIGFPVWFMIFNNVLAPYIYFKHKASFWSDCLEIIEEQYKK